jgi:hypothetical protein
MQTKNQGPCQKASKIKIWIVIKLPFVVYEIQKNIQNGRRRNDKKAYQLLLLTSSHINQRQFQAGRSMNILPSTIPGVKCN